jgi:hypothetical protein
MSMKRTLVASVVALLLPLSATWASTCSLSCSLLGMPINCRIQLAAAKTQVATASTNMPPGMDMETGRAGGLGTRAKPAVDLVPHCACQTCNQASTFTSVVRDANGIQIAKAQLLTVDTLDLIPPSTRPDWTKREARPHNIETICPLSVNLRI